MFRPRADSRPAPARPAAGPAPTAELVDDELVVSGPDLDQVLTVVGDRLGPDAEVLDAQRAIVGGIGGFFGREEFTVRARVPAAAAAPTTATAPAAPVAPVAPVAGAAPLTDAPPTAGGVTAGGVTPGAVTAGGVTDGFDTAPAPLDGATFAAALAEALAEVDGVVGSAVEPNQVEPDQVEPNQVEPNPVEPARVAPEDVHAHLTPAAFDLLHDDAPVTSVVSPLTEPAWTGAPILALSAPDLSEDQLRSHLTELVGTPPVLPLHGVVAVVGDPTDAIATAELLAVRGGLDPADVLVAAPGPVEGRPSWLTVTDPADAARRRARWGSTKRLTIVAVTLHPGIEGLQWTRTLLDALDANQVRLAVAGWRHLDEVVPRLRGLQRVDAIDLCTPVDPTAASGFLGLPVPVGLLEGRPATVDAWVDHLRPHDSRPADALRSEGALRPEIPVHARAEDSHA